MCFDVVQRCRVTRVVSTRWNCSIPTDPNTGDPSFRLEIEALRREPPLVASAEMFCIFFIFSIPGRCIAPAVAARTKLLVLQR